MKKKKVKELTWEQKHSREKLRCLLRDLGIRSARDKLEVRMVQFSEVMLRNASMNAVANFGMPTQIFMSPDALEAYQKAFGNKKS